MKLLLTSNGFSNGSIAQALFELVGKKAEEISLVFIPTASNIETGDKEWFIDDLINIKKQGFKCVCIADISAIPEDIWRPEMEKADVLFFEGGNTYHLMKWMEKSGLTKILPEMLKTKVYVGLSAGSMVTAPELNLHLSRIIYGEDAERTSMKGLGLVDFLFLPHLNSPYFPVRREGILAEAMKDIKQKTYVLDDQSALKISDGNIEVVTEGEYLEFN